MELRDMVAAHLPPDAFLRRDRGDGLYVTNAPTKGWRGEIPGFCVEHMGGIARIAPLPATIEGCSYAPDTLASELERFRGSSPGAAVIFSGCIKLIEAPDVTEWEKLDRILRRAAAKALRSGGGEGLYYCALALAEAGRRLEENKRRKNK